MTFKKKIKKLYNSADRININKENKIFIYSDCHRGIGDNADDFKHNHELFLKVIMDYVNLDYLLIELGDGDELWENNHFDDILKEYKKIYEIYANLSLKKKFYLIWGNHNRSRKKKKKIFKKINSLFNEKDDMESHEALVLEHGDNTIFLLHGHHGELINDKLWWVSKFLVRIFWRPIQLKLGLPDMTSPAKNHKVRIRVDKRYIKWVKETKIPVIIGHTHRPSFPKEGQVSYFNSGSCVHPKGISGIEISGKKISLIIWNMSLINGEKVIERKVIGGPLSILSL